jgi:non-haem dioxygenase in morphine synthesis N-terminal
LDDEEGEIGMAIQEKLEGTFKYDRTPAVQAVAGRVYEQVMPVRLRRRSLSSTCDSTSCPTFAPLNHHHPRFQARMATSFTSIPILDLSLASRLSTRSTLLIQLRDAITKVGFLYIKNHGVSSTTIQTLTKTLPLLFALPAPEKERCALHNSPHFLGYSGFGSERTAEKVDHREQFEFATEVDGSALGDADEPWRGLYGPNQVSRRREKLWNLIGNR